MKKKTNKKKDSRRNYASIAKKYAEGGAALTRRFDQFRKPSQDIDTFGEKFKDFTMIGLTQNPISKAMGIEPYEADTQFGQNFGSFAGALNEANDNLKSVSTFGLSTKLDDKLAQETEKRAGQLGGLGVDLPMAMHGGHMKKYQDGANVNWGAILQQGVGSLEEMSKGEGGLLGGLASKVQSEAAPYMQGMQNIGQAVGQGVNDIMLANQDQPTKRGMLQELLAEEQRQHLSNETGIGGRYAGSIGDQGGMNRISGDTMLNANKISGGGNPFLRSQQAQAEEFVLGEQKSGFAKAMDTMGSLAKTNRLVNEEVFNMGKEGAKKIIGKAGNMVGNMMAMGGEVPMYRQGGTVADYRNTPELEMQNAKARPTIQTLEAGARVPEGTEGYARLVGRSHSEVDPATGQTGMDIEVPAENQGLQQIEAEGGEGIEFDGGETFIYPKGKETKEKEARELKAQKIQDQLKNPEVARDMFKRATLERQLESLEVEEKNARQRIIDTKKAKEATERAQDLEVDQMMMDGKFISKEGTYRKGGKVHKLTDRQKKRMSDNYSQIYNIDLSGTVDSYQDGENVKSTRTKELERRMADLDAMQQVFKSMTPEQAEALKKQMADANSFGSAPATRQERREDRKRKRQERAEARKRRKGAMEINPMAPKGLESLYSNLAQQLPQTTQVDPVGPMSAEDMRNQQIQDFVFGSDMRRETAYEVPPTETDYSDYTLAPEDEDQARFPETDYLRMGAPNPPTLPPPAEPLETDPEDPEEKDPEEEGEEKKKFPWGELIKKGISSFADRPKKLKPTEGDILGMEALKRLPEDLEAITAMTPSGYDLFDQTVTQRAEDTIEQGTDSIESAKQARLQGIRSQGKALSERARGASGSMADMLNRQRAIQDSVGQQELRTASQYDTAKVGQMNKLADMQRIGDFESAKDYRQYADVTEEQKDNLYSNMYRDAVTGFQAQQQQAKAMNQRKKDEIMAAAINQATGFEVDPNTGQITYRGQKDNTLDNNTMKKYGGPARKYRMGGSISDPTQRMMGEPEQYFWGALVKAVPAVMGALGGGGGGGMLGGLLGGGGGGGGLLGGLLGGGNKKEEGGGKGGMLGGLLGGLMEDGGQVPKNILASRLRSHMSEKETQDYLDNYRSGGMIKRADGSYSKRGLWDNIRANKGSGKKPTAEMLKQERKIKREEGKYRYGSKVSRYQDGSSVTPNDYTFTVSDSPNMVDLEPEGGYSTPDGTSIGLDGKPDMQGTLGNIFRMNQDKLMGMAGNLVGDGIEALLDTRKPLRDRPTTKLFSSPTEKRLSAVQKRLGMRDTQKKPLFNI